MSIRKMISLHPDVVKSGHVNQALGDAVHHAMYCTKMCLSCADACAAAVGGAFPAHGRAQLAMLMVVFFALGRAFVASAGA